MNPLFYNKLPFQKKSINQLLGEPNVFQRIPSDWLIIVTDIKGSTKAVQKGMAELVNLIATGSIIAAVNIAAKSNVDIPFFFGGDGATLLAPPNLLGDIIAALTLHQSNVKAEFNMDLRVGSLPVSAVYKNNFELKIAKLSINALYTIPVVLGNGLHYAEKIIKSREIIFPTETTETEKLNLEGMECRWNKIPPPKNAEEVVCLLINSVKEVDQAAVFKKILDKVKAIYGSHKERNPISLTKLKMNSRLKRVRMELRMRQPNFSFLEWIKNWLFMIGGKYWYLPSEIGQKYLNELVKLCDIFVLDGRINMVISGKATQRSALVDFLEELEKNGEIIYGIHVSQESIISCYVRNREAHHIHFIDGGDGGYTQAAVLLKEKIRK